jgi:glycosyltransferase involved in cell wall biosynthesis
MALFELLESLTKQEARIKVLSHERNQGKGAALRTGISKASADIILIQDTVFSSRFIGSN